MHDRLSDVNPALTRLEHFVDDVERRVTWLENVPSCREEAAETSTVGVQQTAGAPNAQSDRVRFAVVALSRVDQDKEGALVRADATIMPAPSEVQGVEETCRPVKMKNRSETPKQSRATLKHFAKNQLCGPAAEFVHGGPRRPPSSRVLSRVPTIPQPNRTPTFLPTRNFFYQP